MTKTVRRKLRIARTLLHDQGIIAVAIRSLEFIQKTTRRANPVLKHDISTSAPYNEVLHADPSRPANGDWPGLASAKKTLIINWLMPPPGKGSGGHMTIYRFIEYLEKAGHVCRIYLHNPGPGSSVEAVQAIMGDSFPKVSAQMKWLQHNEQMEAADAVFATSWQTAYTVFTANIEAKKFYFVQDFEPYFYPVGGMSVLAENTYRLGLRGITAGGWLEKKLHSDYGMVTTAFGFGADTDIYTYDNSDVRKEVVFYARPTTARRAFELGIVTLDLFHKQHPDYTINFIGWDVSEFNIPFPHNNLGILDPHELNELYNRCSVSLVMSLTNMSLLPLELLASGCVPVVTDGENNRLVSDNPYIAYAPANDPFTLANTMTQVIERENPTGYAQAASGSIDPEGWSKAGEAFVGTVEKSVHTKGAL